MRDDYQYIDPDDIYTNPKTGVLWNLAGATDHSALTFTEAAATAKRANELRVKPIRVIDSGTLFAIHRHLFQDLYNWAGERRKVEISKSGKQFFPLSHFDNALKYINDLLEEYKRIDMQDKSKLSRKLAEILDAVNYFHPFRDGNGRTQREFVRFLALEKGWELNLNPPDNMEVFDRYMAGTINGDVNILTDLIHDCLMAVKIM